MITLSPDLMDDRENDAHDNEHHFHEEDFKFDLHKPSKMVFHQEDEPSQMSDYDCPDTNAHDGVSGIAPEPPEKTETDFVDQMRSMLEHISDFIDQIMIKSKHSRESYYVQDEHHHHKHQHHHQHEQHYQDDNDEMHSDCPLGQEPHFTPFNDNHLNDLIKPQEYNEIRKAKVEPRFNLTHAIDLHKNPQKLTERHKHLSEKFSLKSKLTNHLQDTAKEKTHIEIKTNSEEKPVKNVVEFPVSSVGASDHPNKNEIDQQMSSKSLHSPVMEDASGKGVPVLNLRDSKLDQKTQKLADDIVIKEDENEILSQDKYIEPLASLTARKSFKSAANIARNLKPSQGSSSDVEIRSVGPDVLAPTRWDDAGEDARVEAKFLGFGQVEKSKLFDFDDSTEMQALLTCQFVDKGTRNVSISEVKWAKFSTKSVETFRKSSPSFECPRDLQDDCKVDSIMTDSSVTIHPRPSVQRYANGIAPGYSMSLHLLDDKHKGPYRCSARRQVDGKDELVYRIVLVE